MPLDHYFSLHETDNPDSYAVKTYKKFRVAASRTLRSILITVNAKLGVYDTPELEHMLEEDDVNISGIGRRKTALFVVVSDTDRSMDGLVNLFFTQAMNELCRYADTKCADYRLPVPVRFIMDDFATNCKIDEFPRMIASIRSREISTTLIIQAESQLSKCYGDDGRTIIGNCDTYVYLGGNDVETAKAVAERCDMPVKKILNMPVGTNWIFRRGEEPRNGVNFKLDEVLHDLEVVI
jgi:type IV secretion system protein VirD4